MVYIIIIPIYNSGGDLVSGKKGRKKEWKKKIFLDDDDDDYGRQLLPGEDEI